LTRPSRERHIFNAGVKNVRTLHTSGFIAAVLTAFSALPALAQAPSEPTANGDIVVTAQRREENLKDVPLSVAAISGAQLDAIQAGGTDIRGLAARIPSLNVESSFGRTFPRFYIRGLGNTDFDLNASQPVSLVYDDVVLENPILKGFPIFDLQRVEVLRGPQGTLFGRNTPAGIVKFDTVKPNAKGSYAKISYGSYGSFNLEGAVGGKLSETISARLSVLNQRRRNWVDNLANGAGNDLEGYNDFAARLQLQLDSGPFTARLVGQLRNEDGTARLFRANLFAKGSNKLVGVGGAGTPFRRDQVNVDGINFQRLNNYNAGLTMDYDLGGATLTSVTSWWSGNLSSRGDIDGGNTTVAPRSPTFIPFSANSEDGVPGLDQISQELRVASNGKDALTYQAGLFYFSEVIKIDSFNYDTPQGTSPSVTVRQRQKSDAFGAFASLSYALTPELNVTGGIRYNNDKRDYTNSRAGFFGAIGNGKARVSEDNVTWDLSARYAVSPEVNLYARASRGYRAPSIQGRALFEFGSVQNSISTAKSETINSYEVGLKSAFLDNAVRFNLTGFVYQLKNAQLTAVGGLSNAAKLLNAAKVNGYGFEAEIDVRPTQGLQLTAGLSLNDTKIKDPNLFVAGCGSACTVLDPQRAGSPGIYSINGNALPQAPRWTANWTARYGVPVGNGELYAFTDWAYRSKINFFLYDSVEYNSNSLLEGGLRVGYQFGDKRYDIAAFARNITDAEAAVGGIDFNNLTGFVNEPRIIGVEIGVKF
jgi:iron complex outermembrane recepter protein